MQNENAIPIKEETDIESIMQGLSNLNLWYNQILFRDATKIDIKRI